MKQYIKDGKVVSKPKVVILNGKMHLNPRDETIVKAGYEIKEDEIKKPVITNDIIKIRRQNAYKIRADKYLIAYQAYKELGETEKAFDMKTLWLEERKKIDTEYPYLTEKDLNKDVEQTKTE